MPWLLLGALFATFLTVVILPSGHLAVPCPLFLEETLIRDSSTLSPAWHNPQLLSSEALAKAPSGLGGLAGISPDGQE